MTTDAESKQHKSSICHFICSGCRTVLSIPESAFSTGGYTLNCEMCNRLIAIRPVSVDGAMEVLELSGCQYAGKAFPTELPPPVPGDIAFEQATSLKESVGNWIADSVGTEEIDRSEEPAEAKSPLSENLVSKWEIHRNNGEVFEFETFSLIRQWVEQEKITAGDEIIPSGGTKQLIETYPGTADLFGNEPLPPTQSRQSFSAKPALKRLRKKRVKQIFLIALVVFIAAGIAGAPSALRFWHIREGKNFIDGLIVGVTSRDIPKIPAYFQEGKTLLRADTTESLPEAASLFLKVLSQKPTDPATLAALAETWTEIGALTGEKREFHRAHKLIVYAKALDKKHSAPKQAESRWLWRTGKTAEAMDQLKKIETLNLDGQLLFAKIAMSQSDFTNATIALSDALKQEPNNIPLLMGLVDVFEKQAKYPEAASYLRRAESLTPDPAPYRTKLKALYKKAGDNDALETLLRKSVATRTTTAEVDHYELIKLLASQTRTDEIIQESLNYFADYPEGQYDQEIRKLYEAALSGKNATKRQTRRPRRRRPSRSRGLRRSH